MKKTILTLTLAFMFAVAATGATVDLGTISDYSVSGTSFTLGGLEFGNFTVMASAIGGGSEVGPEGIALKGKVDGDKVRLYFSGGWTADKGEVVNTLINFTVTSLSAPLISNTLMLDGYGSMGTGKAIITENTIDSSDAIIASKLVYSKLTGAKNKDTAIFDVGQMGADVTKNIFVGGGKDGLAYISGFSQTFTAVPEPITLAMLGLGGLLIRRRS